MMLNRVKIMLKSPFNSAVKTLSADNSKMTHTVCTSQGVTPSLTHRENNYETFYERKIRALQAENMKYNTTKTTRV